MGLHLEVAGAEREGRELRGWGEGGRDEVSGCGDRGQRHDPKSMQILYKEALGDLS